MSLSNLKRSTVFLSLVICLVLIALSAWKWQEFVVDDAYIGFKCIRNFLAGDGMVFETGFKVEAVTNIGWLLFVSPLARFFEVSQAVRLAGLLSLLFCLVLLLHLAKKLDTRPKSGGGVAFFVLLVPLVVFSEPSLVYFSLSGMETAFLASVLLAAALLFEKTGRFEPLAVLAAFAYLIRPECILFFPAVIAFSMFSREFSFRSRLSGLFVWALIIFGITLVRYRVFGMLFPHTFYAKPAAFFQVLFSFFKLLAGKAINVGFPFSGFPSLFLMILGAVSLLRQKPQLAVVISAGAAVGTFFAMYSPDDWTRMPRYFAPYVPLAAILLFAGLQAIINEAPEKWKKSASLFLLVFFLIILADLHLEQIRTLADNSANEYPGYVLTTRNLKAAADEIAEMTGAEDTLAIRRIGLVGFTPSCRIFDFAFGLPDPEVVQARIRAGGRYFDNPLDPGLAELWQKRRPRFFLEDRSKIMLNCSRPGDDIEFSRSGISRLNLHGIVYREVKSWKIGNNEDWVLLEASN